jgi:hypothetical protein
MKMELTNETGFRDDLIRALIYRVLVVIGYRLKAHSLEVEVVHSRSHGVSGRARVGTNRIKLYVPKPRAWRNDTWRLIVATVFHECLHLVGVRDDDMIDEVLRANFPLQAWARDLQPFCRVAHRV